MTKGFELYAWTYLFVGHCRRELCRETIRHWRRPRQFMYAAIRDVGPNHHKWWLILLALYVLLLSSCLSRPLRRLFEIEEPRMVNCTASDLAYPPRR